MDDAGELRLLLRALADGAVDPNLLAVVAGDWSGNGPGLIPFLVARGVLRPADLGRLAAGGSTAPETSAGAGTRLAGSAERDETGTFQPGEVTSEQAPPADHGPPPGAPDLPPDGRYRILGFHDRGGLGEVWRAEDRLVGRVVALKTLRRDRPYGPTARARFVREARITGGLEHPSVVPVYDLSADGDPFYVMRFVAGRTLADAVKAYHDRRAAGTAGRLDLAALLDAFVGVCRAVAFAHSRGVLHRDLKGQNVILGDFGEVFLLDWGLGKPSGPGSSGETPPADPAGAQPTVAGAVVGTPAYMAPEVAEHEPASPASDVYGLGAMLYAVLTGKAPYSGSTIEEVLDRVKRTPPAPVREVNPAAPPALAAVCRKAMARDPHDRYATADELATDVRRFLADEPVAAYREPLLARAGRWARRHRTAVTAAAAVLVAVTLASSVGAALIAREQRATEKERDRAEANFDLAWVVVDGLGEATADSETGRRANPSDPDRLRLVGNTVDVTRRVLAARPDEPDLRARAARVLWYAGHLGQFLNDAGPADEAYRESVALQRGLADQFPDHPDHRIQLSRVLRDRAGLLRRTGRLGEAAATAGEAVAVADRVRAADPAGWEPQFSLALALTVRYGAELARGQYAAAGRSAQESADLLDELLAAPRDRYHPYAPLFRADARSLRAVAVREEGRAGGGAWDPGPALRLHDEAVGRLRELVAADGRRDFLFQLYAALVQRAETGRTAPGREARAGRDLDEAVAGLAELARQHTAVGHYREELARGLIARGRVRATAARTVGDPAGSLAAEADLFRAVGLLEGLSQESPKLPEYRGLLGEAWAALAPLADDRAGTGLLGHPFPAAAGVVADRKALQTRVHRALSSFRRAQEFCPDDPSYPRRLAEEERAWGPVAAWVTAENQAGRR